jgi:hypothetical protein
MIFMTIEQNIKNSFRDVKLEMISVKTQIVQLAENQKELRDAIDKLQKTKPRKKQLKRKL